jgi:hypothetical protein
MRKVWKEIQSGREWIVDADLKDFFDAVSHDWLVKFIEHRIADRRVVRLIQKWLNACVLEDGKRIRMEKGTPQGGSASPLMANSYLHHVFDLWVQAWRRKRVQGGEGQALVVAVALGAPEHPQETSTQCAIRAQPASDEGVSIERKSRPAVEVYL